MPHIQNSIIQIVHKNSLKILRFLVFHCFFSINKLLYIWILIIRDIFSLYKLLEHKNDVSYFFGNENTEIQSTSQPTDNLRFQIPNLHILYCSQQFQGPQNCRIEEVVNFMTTFPLMAWLIPKTAQPNKGQVLKLMSLYEYFTCK